MCDPFWLFNPGADCTRISRNNFTTKHKLRFKIYVRDGKEAKQSHQNWATLLENIIRVFGYFWNWDRIKIAKIFAVLQKGYFRVIYAKCLRDNFSLYLLILMFFLVFNFGPWLHSKDLNCALSASLRWNTPPQGKNTFDVRTCPRDWMKMA